MADTISDQHGASAVRARLNAIDPNRQAYDKMFGPPTATKEGTIIKLIEGHNEVFKTGGIADDVADIKSDLSRRPF